MSMQVNSPFIIELIFKNKFIFTLSSFSKYQNPKYSKRFRPYTINDAISEHRKPIGFKLIKLNLPVHTPKLINWLKHDFKDRSDPDPLLWFASVGTMPIELRQYLIPFHAE